MTTLTNHRTLTRAEALRLEAHPYAEALPMANAADADAIVASMSADGIQAPVVLYEGRVLDGRNRLRAANYLALGVPVCDFNGTDDEAFRFALDANTARRQMNDSQRAIVASTTRERLGLSQVDAAERFGVSERYVRDADFLLANGTPQQVAAVHEGRTSLRVMMRTLRGERAAVRRRRTLVQAFPSDPRLAAMRERVLDPAMQQQVTQVTELFAAGAVDASDWYHALPAEQVATMLPALEAFVRQAIALAIEEGALRAPVRPGEPVTAPTAPAPASPL